MLHVLLFAAQELELRMSQFGDAPRNLSQLGGAPGYAGNFNQLGGAPGHAGNFNQLGVEPGHVHAGNVNLLEPPNGTPSTSTTVASSNPQTWPPQSGGGEN